jgi:signal transduction histidine kinase
MELWSDLHDEFQQYLAAASQHVAAAQLYVDRGDTHGARGELGELAPLVDEMFEYLREELHGVRLAPGGRGLADAVEALCRRAMRGGLRVEARIAPSVADCAIPDGAAHHLYKIISEAMTNARKHARPTRVVVAMYANTLGLHAAVGDDGVGIPDGRAGNGLDTIRRRARVVGASVDVDSAPGAGTVVHLWYPTTVRGRGGRAAHTVGACAACRKLAARLRATHATTTAAPVSLLAMDHSR